MYVVTVQNGTVFFVEYQQTGNWSTALASSCMRRLFVIYIKYMYTKSDDLVIMINREISSGYLELSHDIHTIALFWQIFQQIEQEGRFYNKLK